MKTTPEIPDPVFRRAWVHADDGQIPPRRAIIDAVAEKLEERSRPKGGARAGLGGRLRRRKEVV